jgi:hypothetical protein
MNHGYRIHHLIVGDDISVSVVDKPTLCLNRTASFLNIFCLFAVKIMLYHADIKQPYGQKCYRRYHGGAHQHGHFPALDCEISVQASDYQLSAFYTVYLHIRHVRSSLLRCRHCPHG